MKLLFMCLVVLSLGICAGCGKDKYSNVTVPSTNVEIKGANDLSGIFSYYNYDADNFWPNHPGETWDTRDIRKEHNFLYLEFIYDNKPASLVICIYESGFAKILYNLDAVNTDKISAIRGKWQVNGKNIRIADVFDGVIIDETSHQLGIKAIDSSSLFASLKDKYSVVKVKKDTGYSSFASN